MKKQNKLLLKNYLKCTLIFLSAAMIVFFVYITLDSKDEETDTSIPVVNPNTTITPNDPTVDEFNTTWYFQSYHGDMENTPNQMKISLSSAITSIEESYVYHESMPMIENVTYRISFSLSASTPREVQLFFKDANSNYVALNETVSTSNEEQYYSFDVTINNPTVFTGMIGFNVGNTSIDVHHEIYISNFMVQEINNPYSQPTIKVNQTGYLPDSQKRFVVPYEQGDMFAIIDTITNETVYVGGIVGEFNNTSANELNSYGDFSDFTKPGNYKIVSQLNGYSHEFEIAENIYDDILNSATKMFTYMRCGTLLEEAIVHEFAHDDCHDHDATIYSSDITVDVSGGWHDAGDYGRYTQTGVKAVSDLLLAYLLNPEQFGDDSEIAESNNGIADILDEAKVELDWLLKMQNDEGKVYDKVVTSQFADFVSPDEDNQELIIFEESSTAVGGFVGAMALASIVYQDIDPEYANIALEAATLSYQYLQGMGYRSTTNPPEVSAGEYRDEEDIDERYFADALMYAATNDRQYLDNAINRFSGNEESLSNISWSELGTYGTYMLLGHSNLKEIDTDFYNTLVQNLTNQAQGVLDASYSDGYFISLFNSFVWGSNAEVANHALVLILANEIVPNETYLTYAFEHLHYLLGRNALNISFVTKTGDVSPQNIHDRASVAVNSVVPGALVGGPNLAHDDSAANTKLSEDTPPALSYVDDADSYTTNEIAIYWNSAFVFLLSSLM